MTCSLNCIETEISPVNWTLLAVFHVILLSASCLELLEPLNAHVTISTHLHYPARNPCSVGEGELVHSLHSID